MKCPSGAGGGQYKKYVVDHETLKSDSWFGSQQYKTPSLGSTLLGGHRAVRAIADPTRLSFRLQQYLCSGPSPDTDFCIHSL